MVTARLLAERRGSFRAQALSEEVVATAWESQLLAGELRASSGERMQVVYRGRRNADAGPDYRDAIIALEDGRLLHGDVEVHVRASDWRSHGHSRDRRYDGVVLHVVMWDDVGSPTLLSNGNVARVLSLAPFLMVPLDSLRDMARHKPRRHEPCSRALDRLEPEDARRLLEKAGQARLMRKVATFEAAVAVKGRGQALYEGLMEALGYAKNREPFLRLAEYLPLSSLQGVLQGRSPDEAARRAEAILLGTAGLLPSQRRSSLASDYVTPKGHPAAPSLEEAWRTYGGESWMSEEDWNFFRTRPENFPTRRIAGAARLVVRSLGLGLDAYLLRGLNEPSPLAVRNALTRAVLVAAVGEAAPVGRGRAKVILVNVVLPYAIASGNLSSRASFRGKMSDRAKWAYFAFPKLPSDAVVRQTSLQLFGTPSSAVVDSASRQQGLHHIFSEYCRWRRCDDCLLNNNG